MTDARYESERDIVAYHEAGHAIMVIACGFQLAGVSIEKTDAGEGLTEYFVGSPIEGEVAQKTALVSASGLAADYLLAQQSGKPRLDDVMRGHSNDQEKCREFIQLSRSDGTFEDYMIYAMLFLRQNWNHVESIANALKLFGTFNTDSLNFGIFPKLPDDWQQGLAFSIRDGKQQHGA